MRKGDAAIGVFDSGLGGLTVVREIAALLPAERVIYFGDTARIPYGTKSPDAVTRYALQATAFLSTFNLKLMVVACNTASSLALSAVSEAACVPVEGVIEPGCRAAASATKARKIGVIGTEGTIQSGAYAAGIHAIDPACEVHSAATPLFVPMVEEGRISGEVPRLVAEEYLAPLLDKGIDVLVLGCTHYPLLRGVLGEVAGPGVSLVDSAVTTAGRVRDVLAERNALAPAGRPGQHRFYVSDDPAKFAAVAGTFLGDAVGEADWVDIERY